jgi:hypothetical protein
MRMGELGVSKFEMICDDAILPGHAFVSTSAILLTVFADPNCVDGSAWVLTAREMSCIDQSCLRHSHAQILQSRYSEIGPIQQVRQ